jgi:hypothetical protein
METIAEFEFANRQEAFRRGRVSARTRLSSQAMTSSTQALVWGRVKTPEKTVGRCDFLLFETAKHTRVWPEVKRRFQGLFRTRMGPLLDGRDRKNRSLLRLSAAGRDCEANASSN